MRFIPKEVPIKKWPKCRTCRKAPAVYGTRCGHCYAALVKKANKKAGSSRQRFNVGVAL